MAASQRNLLAPSPYTSTAHFPSPFASSASFDPNPNPFSSPADEVRDAYLGTSTYRVPNHPYGYASTYTSPPTPLSNLGRSKAKAMEAGASPPDSPPGSSHGHGGWKPEPNYPYERDRAFDSGSVRAFFDDTKPKPQRKAWWQRPWTMAVILLCLVGVAALAVGLGVHYATDGKSASRTPSANSGSGGEGSNSTGSGSGTNSSAPAQPAYNVSAIAPLPKWNWTDSSQKMIGISLGNYLVLERWMTEDWFVGAAGPDAYDEWTFTNFTGGAAPGLLQAHWDSWVSEDDIERVYQAGVNTIRVPTGYWAWIPTIEGEPYVQAGQLDRLELVMSWAYKRGMYVLVDLHGLPGSQNGEQQSGHNTSDVRFYQPAYQTRSDATLAAALSWISSSPYRSVVSGIEVCNEPRPNSDDNFSVLAAYYERSYTACTNRSDPVPMIFHHGFPNTDHLAYWLDFVTGKDPNFLILEDHPYPGNFPLQTDEANILYQVCQDAASYEGYPVPVAVTEWSLTTGVNDTSFESQFYAQQLTAWAWSAGSVFWSLRANISQLAILAAPPNQQKQYSFLDLLDEGGIIALPSNTNQSSASFISSLNQGCGNIPGEQWSNWTFSTVPAQQTYTSGSLTSFPTSTAA
ncbi:glycoside hydrolase family 5 protein [Calocera viscosa TUFC12733]|uniref:glucan 1,3-beta-glucosidase n=1 Tax=Calocera viscosa (strain TUFC12733) TaxID=1330018 RepID=A0A167MHH5_CALVF|nr:glycoside hydrolase family 5 protein [Calocera viscosa TUFC12733]